MMVRRIPGAFALALIFGTSFNALADTYPERPVTLVVGYAAGGPNDIVARLVADGLHGPLGQPVLVENRAGAAGAIAADQVARSAPDGYTALMTSLNHVTGAVLNKTIKFDTETAFAPVAAIAIAPHVLVVRTDSAIRSYEDFMNEARAKPGTVTIATSGTGGSPHLVMELFQLKADTTLVHVPYKGAAPAVADLLGGHVMASFATLGSVGAQIEAGQLRVLAIASDERSTLLPDTPTFSELGVEGLVLDAWYGLLFPAGTSPAIIARMHGMISRVVKTPEFREKLFNAGMTTVDDSSPASFSQRISDEIALVREITDEAGISLD